MSVVQHHRGVGSGRIMSIRHGAGWAGECLWESLVGAGGARRELPVVSETVVEGVTRVSHFVRLVGPCALQPDS